jgi:hypothetical protein
VWLPDKSAENRVNGNDDANDEKGDDYSYQAARINALHDLIESGKDSVFFHCLSSR